MIEPCAFAALRVTILTLFKPGGGGGGGAAESARADFIICYICLLFVSPRPRISVDFRLSEVSYNIFLLYLTVCEAFCLPLSVESCNF